MPNGVDVRDAATAGQLGAGAAVLVNSAGAYALGATGLVMAGLIVAAFSGAFYPVDIPPRYLLTFR